MLCSFQFNHITFYIFLNCNIVFCNLRPNQ
nr:MAG TPA: hypothetical protein [Caudoviricetes sp.]